MSDTYDIFIAFVAEDEPGEPSFDSMAARELAERFAEYGVRAFLSDENEPARETAAALQSAKTVIAVASCPEYDDIVRRRLERNRLGRLLQSCDVPRLIVLCDGFIPEAVTSAFPAMTPLDFDELGSAVACALEPLGIEAPVDDDDETMPSKRSRMKRAADKASKDTIFRDALRKLSTRTHSRRLRWRQMPAAKKALAVLSIWAAIALVVGCAFAFLNRTIRQDGLICKPQKDGTCTLIGFESVPSSLVIPAEVGGRTVTAIGDNAFAGCGSLTGVRIPDGVTVIGSRAFADCVSLTDVAIPNSVNGIGFRTFGGCISLKSINLPEGLDTIGGDAFSDCTALENIELPAGLQTVGFHAFSNCVSLESVTIPDSVTYIDSGAFIDCSGLKEILVSGGNRYFSSVDGVLYDRSGSRLICCPAGREGVFVIPESVTEIAAWAFGSCGALTGVTIPDSVTSIGGHAFLRCTALTGVTVPDSVTYIGSGAFEECASLTDVQLPAGLSAVSTNLFRNCGSLAEVTIPDGVTELGFGVFSGCSSLESVSLPDGVSRIGANAFYNCTALTSAELPAGLTEIGISAFYGCTALTAVNIPDGVVDIAPWAFAYCGSLTEAAIPASVTSIGQHAFEHSFVTVHAPKEASYYGYEPDDGVMWVVE